MKVLGSASKDDFTGTKVPEHLIIAPKLREPRARPVFTLPPKPTSTSKPQVESDRPGRLEKSPPYRVLDHSQSKGVAPPTRLSPHRRNPHQQPSVDIKHPEHQERTNHSQKETRQKPFDSGNSNSQQPPSPHLRPQLRDRDPPPHVPQSLWTLGEDPARPSRARDTSRAAAFKRFILPHLGLARFRSQSQSQELPMAQRTKRLLALKADTITPAGTGGTDVPAGSGVMMEPSPSRLYVHPTRRRLLQQGKEDRLKGTSTPTLPPLRPPLAMHDSSLLAGQEGLSTPLPPSTTNRYVPPYLRAGTRIGYRSKSSDNVPDEPTGRGRGGGRHGEIGPGRQIGVPPMLLPCSPLLKGLGEQVGDVGVGSISMPKGSKTEIEGVTVVGSYKWVESEGEVATIAVPGIPDMWDPPERVGILRPDALIPAYIEHEHYVRTLIPPNLHTLEPLFLSLTDPSILAQTDIVTTRHSLRQIFFACCTSERSRSPWRIDIDVVDGLILLIRVDEEDTIYDRSCTTNSRPTRTPTGYHLSYFEATNKRILQGSDRTTGCKWINHYTFGGQRILVSSDVHSFIPTEAERSKYADGDCDPYNMEEPLIPTGSAESLTSMMSGLDFDDPAYNGACINIRRTNFTPTSSTTVSPSLGTVADVATIRSNLPSQSALGTIKTRLADKDIDMEYYFPQMYFAQIPTLFYARHESGDFSDHPVEVVKLGEGKMREVEAGLQGVLNRVAAVLREVVWVARQVEGSKQHGEDKKLSMVWDGLRLKLFKRSLGAEFSEGAREMIGEARRRGAELRMDVEVVDTLDLS